MRSGALTLRIDSRLEHVALVGVAVRAIGAAIPLDDDETAGLELCVVEAVNNVIEHAYGAEAGHPVEVELTITDRALHIGVRDCGRSMDWAAACGVADAYGDDALVEGGRGIFIIRSLMDRVSYEAAGGWNELTMIKGLAGALDIQRLREPPQP